MEVFDRIAFRALADLFLPRLCCVCGAELGRNENFICLGCLSELPLTYSWSNPRNAMAERFNSLIERHGYPLPQEEDPAEKPSEEEPTAPDAADGLPLTGKIDSYKRYVHAVSLFRFVKDSGYRNICYRLKYSGDVREGRFFSAMLGERAAEAPWLRDVDTVVPVPLHWSRRLKRGYNQTEIIAGALAEALGARLRTDILVRPQRTKTQTRLPVEEKVRNVAGAFALGRSFVRTYTGNRKADGMKHILLVDDVFTTGSTLYNCYLPLKKFFGEDVRISIATLALV